MIKNAFFQAQGIQFSVSGRKRPILRLSDFGLEKGQCLFILGENGAGKTSLLSILGGYLVPDAGRIWLNGNTIKPLEQRMVPGFEQIEMVAQNPTMDPFLSVAQNLEKALRMLPEKVAQKHRNYLVKLCRIGPLMDQKTGDLSGGELRRLSIAIALAKEPRILLLDEPFAELDARSKMELLLIFLDIKKEKQISTIIVSHQPAEARWLADEIRILKMGSWLEQIRPTAGRFIPKRNYSARLLGLANLFPQKFFAEMVFPQGQRWVHIPSQSWFFQKEEGLVYFGEGLRKASQFDGRAWQSLWECQGQVLLVSSPIEPEIKEANLYFDPRDLLFLR